MKTVIFGSFMIIQFGFLLCSDPIARKVEAISTTKADITTPLPTVPTILNPATSTSPTLNPTVLNPDATSTPLTATATPPPFSSGASWCVASQAASQKALQLALDYACGHNADCSPVQPGGSCYSPITVRDHASYAFNSYYQKNPVPNSCNFGGAGVITSTDPSYRTCQYPSTSTSSSVLNTASVGSTIFGAGVPTTPASSAAAAVSPSSVFEIFLVVMLEKIVCKSLVVLCYYILSCSFYFTNNVV